VRRGWLRATLAFAVLMAGVIVGWWVATLPSASLVWSVSLGGRPRVLGLALNPRTSNVFVLDHDRSTVSMLDGNGRLMSTTSVSDYPISFAVDQATARVIVATEDYGYETVTLLNGRTGAAIRTTVVSAGTLGNPVVVAGETPGALSYVTDANGIAVLDPRRGMIERTIPADAPPFVAAVDIPRSLIYLRQGDRMIHVLDTRTGQLIARFMLPEETDLLAGTLAGSYGYAVVSRGDTVALDRMDLRRGTIVSSSMLSGYPIAAVMDRRTQRIFFALNRGIVSVLNSRTTYFTQDVQVGHMPSALAVDVVRGHVFVANTGDDTLSVLDARNGLVRRTVRVGPGPQAIVVDEVTGRVFVAIKGGQERMVEPDSWQWVPNWVPRGLRRWLPFLPPPGSRVHIITVPPGVAILDEARL